MVLGAAMIVGGRTMTHGGMTVTMAGGTLMDGGRTTSTMPNGGCLMLMQPVTQAAQAAQAAQARTMTLSLPRGTGPC